MYFFHHSFNIVILCKYLSMFIQLYNIYVHSSPAIFKLENDQSMVKFCFLLLFFFSSYFWYLWNSSQVGDGTTTVTLLASEFLKQVKPFIEEGVHAQVAVKSFRKAANLVWLWDEIEWCLNVSLCDNSWNTRRVMIDPSTRVYYAVTCCMVIVKRRQSLHWNPHFLAKLSAAICNYCIMESMNCIFMGFPIYSKPKDNAIHCLIIIIFEDYFWFIVFRPSKE